MIQDLITPETPMARLADLVTFSSGKNWDRKDCSEVPTDTHSVPVWNSGTKPVSFVREPNNNGDIIYFVGIGAGVGFFAWLSDPFYAGALCSLMSVKDKSIVLPSYLGKVLSFIDHKPYKSGTAQPFYDGKLAMERIQIPLPPLEDQKRIASYLDNLTEAIDTSISLQQDTVELLRQQKTALWNRIFDTSERTVFWFGGKRIDTGDWALKSLQKVAPHTREVGELANYRDEDYVSTETMISNSGGISPYARPVTGKTSIIHHPGDILVNRIRPYLQKIHLSENSGGTSGDVLVFRPNSSEVLPEFIFTALSTKRYADYLMGTVAGMKMPRADKAAMGRYEILLPPLRDQVTFSEYFSHLNSQIALEQDRLELLREQKAAYNGRISSIFAQAG